MNTHTQRSFLICGSLFLQAGAAPQTWEHLSTIHENSGVAITPEQVAAVAAVAGHGVPLANMSSQRYQVPNGGPGDGFAGMES